MSHQLSVWVRKPDDLNGGFMGVPVLNVSTLHGGMPREVSFSAVGKKRHRPLVFALGALAVAALGGGWHYRALEWVTPREGLGYGLGWTGGLLILTMLLYPLRKRIRSMREWGHMKYWLAFHVFSGIVVPVLVLFHCNFSLGAVNSNVALMSLGVVVASGLVGRYLYRHLHHRATGQAFALRDLQQRLGQDRQAMVRNEHLAYDIVTLLSAMEARYRGRQVSAWEWVTLGFHVRAVRRKALSMLRQDNLAERGGNDVDRALRDTQLHLGERHIRDYLDALRVVIEYPVFLRLFGWWHVAHIPVMVLFLATAVVHVFAVHWY